MRPFSYFIFRLIEHLLYFIICLSENTWNPQEEPGYSIVAIHPFQAASNSEISFQRGQMLQLAPSHYYNVEASSGWLLAADLEGRVGFIPSNRVARVTNHHVPPVNTTHVNQPVNTAVPVWSETANSKSEENVACKYFSYYEISQD